MDLSDSIGDIEAEGWQGKMEFEVQKEGTVEIGYRLYRYENVPIFILICCYKTTTNVRKHRIIRG